MKTRILILSFVACSFTVTSQNQILEKDTTSYKITCTAVSNFDKEPLYIIDGVPMVNGKDSLNQISPEAITSISVVKGEEATALYGTSGTNGVVLIQTKKGEEKEKKCIEKSLPFTVHCIKNENWVIQQDMYNALRARVPSLNISNVNTVNQIPNIRIRGNDGVIVMLDGIRVDASILNTLNPEDIESIHVAPSAAGTNYFLNGFRTN